MKKIALILFTVCLIASLASCAFPAPAGTGNQTEPAQTTASETAGLPAPKNSVAYSLYDLNYSLPDSFKENPDNPVSNDHTYYSGTDLSSDAGTTVRVSVYTPGADFDLETYVKQNSTASIVRAQMTVREINGVSWYACEWKPSNGAYHNAYYYALFNGRLYEAVVQKGDGAFDEAVSVLEATLFFRAA